MTNIGNKKRLSLVEIYVSIILFMLATGWMGHFGYTKIIEYLFIQQYNALQHVLSWGITAGNILQSGDVLANLWNDKDGLHVTLTVGDPEHYYVIHRKYSRLVWLEAKSELAVLQENGEKHLVLYGVPCFSPHADQARQFVVSDYSGRYEKIVTHKYLLFQEATSSNRIALNNYTAFLEQEVYV